MRRVCFGFVTTALVAFALGCGGGTPEPAGGNPEADAAKSGAQAAPPGVDADLAQQAAQQFYQTGEVSPEVRKQFEQSSQSVYGQQYPGAGRKPQ